MKTFIEFNPEMVGKTVGFSTQESSLWVEIFGIFLVFVFLTIMVSSLVSFLRDLKKKIESSPEFSELSVDNRPLYVPGKDLLNKAGKVDVTSQPYWVSAQKDVPEPGSMAAGQQ